MNGFILLIPLLFIRFVLLGLINKNAVKRAALYPETIGNERLAVTIYQLSNTIFIIYLLFLKVDYNSSYLIPGSIILCLGIIICTISTIDFARPDNIGLNTKGIYKLSRNPMYVGYFFYFLGCVILTQSLMLFIIFIIFQISSHWLILSEERWCLSTFQDDYARYMNSVRRYL